MRFLFVLLSFLLGSFSVFAQFDAPPNNAAEYEAQYQWRIRQTKLNGVYIPKDLPDALQRLELLTDTESRTRFGSLPEQAAYHELFHSLGRWIVVNWGLHGGSRLSAALAPLGLRHPEDLAHLIVLAWHRSINERPLDLPSLVDTIQQKRRQLYEETLD